MKLTKMCQRTRLTTHLMVLLPLLVISWKIFNYVSLDEPPWSICVAQREVTDKNSNSCLPIYWEKMPGVLENERLTGNLLKPMKEPRSLAKFLISPEISDQDASIKRCKSAGNIHWTIVNLIKSTVSNHHRRNVIRSTWGSIQVHLGLQIRNVFVVGKTKHHAIQKKLEEEVKLHNDILQVDFYDDAGSVPEKVLAGMQWSSMHLHPETLYSSMDDDIVVHIPNLAKYLIHKFLEPPRCRNEMVFPASRPCYEHLPILCVYSYQSKDYPERNWFSKWYTSHEEYSGSTWPKYCRGGMYIVPVKTISELFEISRSMPRIMMDDVWVTGFMRRKMGMGDLNIVPAAHSVRHEFQFRSTNDNFDGILVQHLWGDMADGADIPSQISQVWQSWSPKLTNRNTCYLG
uniref:Hexosyltransferase n=1 Tax=Phallusia mammillata TaxID=59560 RepID=A0A6F9D758_9ASCI|nr:lactosylceramide 1,3-N-acetyl-beta-D-glucosaminyltransferase-like [Phallusia mammillata]